MSRDQLPVADPLGSPHFERIETTDIHVTTTADSGVAQAFITVDTVDAIRVCSIDLEWTVLELSSLSSSFNGFA